jgi:hypothetical protein
MYRILAGKWQAFLGEERYCMKASWNERKVCIVEVAFDILLALYLYCLKIHLRELDDVVALIEMV